MLKFSGDVLYLSIDKSARTLYSMYTPSYWRYFIYYVPTGFDMRKIARPLSIVLSDFRDGIYNIIRCSGIYVYTYLYNTYYKATYYRRIVFICNTVYKSLHINIQFLVNIC